MLFLWEKLSYLDLCSFHSKVKAVVICQNERAAVIPDLGGLELVSVIFLG